MQKRSGRTGKKEDKINTQIMAQLSKYHKVDGLLKKAIFAEVVLSTFVIGQCDEVIAAFTCITLPVLTMLSGYVAHLHRMLPTKYQKKPNGLSISHLGIHPDYTFWVFFILFVICLGAFLPRILY